ncbi:hypothetical protein [Flavitalea sp.]|nr:hypothetical protein [Flavitalea sp.]
MICCDNLIHPFQNDPGISQRQRVIDDLLSGSAQIDGRKTADLLDYFSQLSRHINFYDSQLNISDWQAFFRKSIPFSLTGIIKHNKDTVQQKFDKYNKLFDKRPNRQSLQLIVHFIYFQTIHLVNRWHSEMKGSDLPVERLLEKMIRDKLLEPVKKYICLTNTATEKYRIKKIDFNKLQQSGVWELSAFDLRDTSCFVSNAPTKRKRLIALRNEIVSLFPAFMNIISLTGPGAEASMELSLFPLKEEFQKKHSPHLALLFAFLKLFRYLQNDLNGFTKKHLDFFYQDVLKLNPRDAVPDKTHILFEIQNQLDKYLIKKEVQVKDGKDRNKEDINFALNDEIVVNKTIVADLRTLFLNNRTVFDQTYLEGVYKAPDARKADGIDKDFKDDDAKSFPTVGSKLSKYIPPEKKFFQPYPFARLGFILASPVLLLNEGTRNVTITLACELKQSCNNPLQFYSPELLYPRIKELFAKGFYYISQDLIKEAQKLGIKQTLIDQLWNFLFDKKRQGCWEEETIYDKETFVTARKWRVEFYNGLTDAEQTAVSTLFIERRLFKIHFSGKSEWIEPSNIRRIRFSLLDPVTKRFSIIIKTRLKPDKDPVTFYDKEKFKEDFNTTLPMVKIELDESIKLLRGNDSEATPCCVEVDPGNSRKPVSFYHFLRDVVIVDSSGTKATQIDVRVCGIKKFIVQNDESIQDVNGPIYPFGARPEIIDFDINQRPPLYNPLGPPLVTDRNLIGPSFYVGSKEVFCKKWNEVYINIEWKNKPKDFREYYKAFLRESPGGGPFGLNEQSFLINLSILQEGGWVKENAHILPSTELVTIRNVAYNDRKLFEDNGKAAFCNTPDTLIQTFLLKSSFFTLNQEFFTDNEETIKQELASNGFLKINLQIQDFCHKNYAYVLARQMMALGKLPDAKIEDAMYYDAAGNPIVFSTNSIKNEMTAAGNIANRVEADINLNPGGIKNLAGNLGSGAINDPNAENIRIIIHPNPPAPGGLNLTQDVIDLKNKINEISGIISNNDKFQAIIPNEPWTPIINSISLDYTATATITDIDLIHLYPYAGTYKHEEIELQPTLFAKHCDEGTLFIGLKDFVPGSNLNILFQLAEATSDSESEREKLAWNYLDNNEWKELREGFEVLDDATDGLTTSGIIKFALPENMTKDNTILPKDLHWIKISIPRNSGSVAETIGIHTQAIQVVFTNEPENDKLRLTEPLVAGSIGKLKEADPLVKTIVQPYDSFGGREPEVEKNFYTRVSELLRHKGRAIQKWDYERITLENFPTIYKVKCINHSFALDAKKFHNDFPVAPGYVLLAVIPDLNQLKAGNSFEPKAPVSLLDDIEDYVRSRTSPFVRLRAMNPRYERIQICLKVKLYKGRDEIFYKEKLKEDILEFLAPWAIGEYSKLSFGQCINRSDLLRFIEGLDYVDYILLLSMKHERDAAMNAKIQEICPRTPRSILIGGEIDICIKQDDCEDWEKDQTGNYVNSCQNESVPIKDFCKPPIVIE